MDSLRQNGYINQAYCYESNLNDSIPNHEEVLSIEDGDIQWALDRRSRREPPLGGEACGYVEECVPMLSNEIPKRQPRLQRAASLAYRSDRNNKSFDCSFDGIRDPVSTHIVNPRLNQSFTYCSGNVPKINYSSINSQNPNHSFNYNNSNNINQNSLSFCDQKSRNNISRNSVSHYDLLIYQDKQPINSPKYILEGCCSPPPLPPPRPPKPTVAIQPLKNSSTPTIQEDNNSRKLKKKNVSKISVHSDYSKLKVNTRAPAPFAALSLSGFVMLFCGLATCLLSSYLFYKEGRHYYLDLAIIAGFICFLLGALAIRPRQFEWLPNRNYVSGYMMVSAFSLLTAASLLVLCTLGNTKAAMAAHQVTSGAVVALAALCILLASLGVLTSHCFKYPPMDNRVDSEEIIEQI